MHKAGAQAVSAAEAPERERLLTIGTVCTRLQPEFPDISISKIRYLEDQGLLAPRRTQSGYRLFSEGDVERLETILRLQRDEFLPLRVIRQELASPSGPGKERRRRRAVGLADPDDELDLGELCERAAITLDLARELEEYGLLQPRRAGSEKLYPAGDVDVAVACAKLSRFGISARHLRTFRTAADREAGLLQQVIAPSLRSRNPERREAAVQQLQTLAELAQELSQLLFWRDLRHLAGN
jgi:DNA-binding transcriptional MerR regulator